METERLLKIKADIEQAATRKNELQGELKQITKTIKEDFGLSSVTEAKAALAKWKKQRDSLQERFDTNLAKLEEDYEKLVGSGE